MKIQCLAVILTLSIAVAILGQAPPLSRGGSQGSDVLDGALRDLPSATPASPSASVGSTTDLFGEPSGTSNPSTNAPPLTSVPTGRRASELITISYLEKLPVPQASGDYRLGRIEYRAVNVELEIDSDLDKITLTGDGKRAAVQAITAVRHQKLLQALKDAKSETEKAEAAKKLEENYRAHYAIETTWREERIAELEKRIEVMRAQVKERATSEDKYVEAAMTLAKLHAQGIVAEPPKLKNSNTEGEVLDTSGSMTPTLPYNAPPAIPNLRQ